MSSFLAWRLDNKNFIFEARDTKNCLSELNINNNIIRKQAIKYPSYVLSWIGYIYRFACYEYKLSSKRIYSIIKPKELFMLYEAYHSFDPDTAIIRILNQRILILRILIKWITLRWQERYIHKIYL